MKTKLSILQLRRAQRIGPLNTYLVLSPRYINTPISSEWNAGGRLFMNPKHAFSVEIPKLTFASHSTSNQVEPEPIWLQPCRKTYNQGILLNIIVTML